MGTERGDGYECVLGVSYFRCGCGELHTKRQLCGRKQDEQRAAELPDAGWEELTERSKGKRSPERDGRCVRVRDALW